MLIIPEPPIRFLGKKYRLSLIYAQKHYLGETCQVNAFFTRSFSKFPNKRQRLACSDT